MYKRQTDSHTAQIGYAIDGFGIYELAANHSTFDECNGHEDEIRGYHYHATEPGKNEIIGCLHGVTATVERERDGHRPPPPNHEERR